MAEGGLCSICFAGTLALQSGMLVCEVCGGTVQHFAEETHEYQTGVSDSQFFRKERYGSSQDQAQEVKEKERPDVKAGVDAYVLAVQQLLQIKALCHTYGTSPAIMDIAQEIWTSYLSLSKVLETSFSMALEAKIDAKRATTPAGPFGEFNVVRTIVDAELRVALPISFTLVIAFLACWYAREIISPLDIVHGALNGQLPFMEFPHESADLLSPFSAVLTRNLTTPGGVPGPAALCVRAVELAAALNMRCPMVNASMWMRRYQTELNLPEEIFPIAVTIYNLYSLNFQDNLELQTANPLHPWAICIAFIVLAAKLAIGCDQEAVLELFKRQYQVDWLEWAQTQFSNAHILSAYPLQSAEVIKQSPKILSPYLKYLRETFFSSFSAPEGLSEYQATLFRLSERLMAAQSSQEANVESTRQSVAISNGAASVGRFQYVGKRSPMALTPFGPNYVALLSVCSIKTWIAPHLLAETVRQLEGFIVDSECKTAYAVDQVAQSELRQMEVDAKQR